jgi:hypothetical protein
MHLIVVFLIKIARKITAFNKICTHHQYFLNEIKVLLMAKVHGGNLHHIYADTEILSARSLIILSMAR